MKLYKQIIAIIMCLLCTIYGWTHINYSNHNFVTKKEIHNELSYPQTNLISEKLIYSEELNNILEKYPTLNDIIVEANIRIPNENYFIPQGIALIKNNIFITGYYDSNKNSRCYIINEFGKIINIVELDTNSHVGSISYDKNRNLLWIPDNDGKLNAYNVPDFFNKKDAKSLYSFDYVGKDLVDFQNRTKNLISYLCIDGDYLYIGNFFIDYECTIKKYQIIETDNGIDLKFINKFNVPKRTQSIAFIEYNQKKYMVLSQSYRRRNPSYLYLYEYDENKKNYSNTEIKKIEVPPMLEQISISESAIYLLFESSASKYWDCPEKVEFVISIKANKLFY